MAVIGSFPAKTVEYSTPAIAMDYEVEVSDSISVSDSLPYKVIGKSIRDRVFGEHVPRTSPSITVRDMVFGEHVSMTSPLITVSDRVFGEHMPIEELSKNFTDAITVSDEAFKEMGKRFADAVTVSDQAFRGMEKTFWDYLKDESWCSRGVSSIIKDKAKTVDVMTKIAYTLTGLDVRRVYWSKIMEYVCSVCGLKFFSQEELDAHMLKYHPEVPPPTPEVYALTVKSEPHATVYLNEVIYGLTDSEGNLELTNVLEGSYEVKAEKFGYTPNTVSVEVPDVSYVEVPLTTVPLTVKLEVYGIYQTDRGDVKFPASMDFTVTVKDATETLIETRVQFTEKGGVPTYEVMEQGEYIGVVEDKVLTVHASGYAEIVYPATGGVKASTDYDPTPQPEGAPFKEGNLISYAERQPVVYGSYAKLHPSDSVGDNVWMWMRVKLYIDGLEVADTDVIYLCHY